MKSQRGEIHFVLIHVSEVACWDVAVVVQNPVTWVIAEAFFRIVEEHVDVWICRERISHPRLAVLIVAVENLGQSDTFVESTSSNIVDARRKLNHANGFAVEECRLFDPMDRGIHQNSDEIHAAVEGL